jgi:protein involved in polysaccharide export with SLBB domain
MWRWFLALIFVLSVGTAATAQVSAPASAEPQASATVAHGVDADYRLGAGDKVRIIVFREDSLSGEFLVPGGEGKIAFPLIGDVQAGGLTVTQLQAELEGKLRDGFLKEPRVSIEVLNYRPFYILGEVAKPGEYPYTNGLTVLNAVATANGFTYRADTHKVYIKRANEPTEEEYKLTTSTPVQPGDTIRISERFF